MTIPQFTVIVPTYGRPEYLSAAVESVLRQTVRDLEVVVVDDGGTSTTPDFGDKRVRVIRHERNRGPAASRNTGVAAARGRYVAFLDDDDVYAPTRLACVLDRLSRAPIVLCWASFLGGRKRPGRRLEGNIYDDVVAHLVPHVGVTTIERAAFVPFDERYDAAQDVEWWIRLAECHAVTTVHEFGYLIRRHDAPRHRNGLESRIRCTQLLLEQHADYFAARPHAAAFRSKRMGLLATQLGDSRSARAYFRHSFRLHPTPRAAYRLACSYGPPIRRPIGLSVVAL
jgi:glycosyltransferase involved in cell wall biosynthesis